jgi:hypothetical protein
MAGESVADAAWEPQVEYLVIRGVSDYCDPGKNDRWQRIHVHCWLCSDRKKRRTYLPIFTRLSHLFHPMMNIATDTGHLCHDQHCNDSFAYFPNR